MKRKTVILVYLDNLVITKSLNKSKPRPSDKLFWERNYHRFQTEEKKADERPKKDVSVFLENYK